MAEGYRTNGFSLFFHRHISKVRSICIIKQLQRAAVSVASNIAEGASRSSEKDFAHFLEIAIGSAFEIETQLTIAQRRGYITPKAYDDASSDISILEKQLNQFIGKLKGQG